MVSPLEWIDQHKAAAVVVGVGGLAVLVGGIGAMASGRPPVEVTDVVAGDVVAVAAGDDAWQVSLLNLETPTECLADEARAFLADALPEGTTVRLEEGLAPARPPGPTAAGVVLDDVLVNAEVARAGFGIAVVDGTDATFYDEVLEAQQEAAAAGRGLYSTESECTLAGRVAAYAEAADDVDARAVVVLAGENLGELEEHRTAIAAAAAGGEDLRALLAGDRDSLPLAAYDDDALRALAADVEAVDERFAASLTAADERTAEVERILAERAEAARLAAEEAARQAAEEAARQAAAEAARQAAERAAAEQAAREAAGGGASSGGGGSSSGGGGSAYYANCSEAKAAGAAPLYRGEPGYRSKLDGDGDGVACER